jgi:hypothetical protein
VLLLLSGKQGLPKLGLLATSLGWSVCQNCEMQQVRCSAEGTTIALCFCVSCKQRLPAEALRGVLPGHHRQTGTTERANIDAQYNLVTSSAWQLCCPGVVNWHCTCTLSVLILQALEVALPHIKDTKTLVACSVLNQQCRQSTLDAVRLNLPSLIQHARAELDGYSNDSSKLQHMQWLCSTAGPAAVNTHEAGCAILQLLNDVFWYNQLSGPDPGLS